MNLLDVRHGTQKERPENSVEASGHYLVSDDQAKAQHCLECVGIQGHDSKNKDSKHHSLVAPAVPEPRIILR